MQSAACGTRCVRSPTPLRPVASEEQRRFVNDTLMRVVTAALSIRDAGIQASVALPCSGSVTPHNNRYANSADQKQFSSKVVPIENERFRHFLLGFIAAAETRNHGLAHFRNDSYYPSNEIRGGGRFS